MTALRAEGCGIAAFGGDEYKVSVTGISSLCFRHPKHGGELATFGGFPPFGASFSSLEGRLYGFPTGEARLYGFIQTGAFNYLKGAHHNPRGLKGRVKLKPL